MGDLDGVMPSRQHRIVGIGTLAFTVCFAVWTIFSIIGLQIKRDLGLNDTEFRLLVATPILTGSLSRIFLGIWTHQYGGRLVYMLLMLAAAAATWFGKVLNLDQCIGCSTCSVTCRSVGMTEARRSVSFGDGGSA